MLILALEQSAPEASLALVRDGSVLIERSWTDSRASRQQAFELLPDVLRAAPGGIGSVDLLAVGLGPGAYTGLRMALMIWRGLALPDGRPVYGVPSAEVAAYEILTRAEAPAVCVAGDARRGHAWCRTYSRSGRGLRAEGEDWTLAPAESLPPPPAGTLAAASDPVRLAGLLARWRAAGVAVREQPAPPSAAGLARLAAWRLASGIPSEPLAPIYLHAAVARPATHE
jgi:tRNA threonylcarbamoyladenosine biosynthesis protein TsaB